MKKYQIIILTTILFVVLFYDEMLGINFGFFGIFMSCFTWYLTTERNRTRTFLMLFTTSILSSFAFMWFGDFASFLALVSSLFLLNLKSKARNLKLYFVIPIVVSNAFTFMCRVFKFEKWLPQRKSGQFLQKMIAFVAIPLILVVAFFCVYTYGSDSFANLFTTFEWNINLFLLFGIAFLGFFIAFNYWIPAIEKVIYKSNHRLDEDFNSSEIRDNEGLGILSIEFQRASGVVSLVVLNLLLLTFIITFNYEQFFDVKSQVNQLSGETHERVKAVVISIVMAIGVILYYFKSYFNFDEKAVWLKRLAITWLILNAILILSAIIKNTEYILALGLTYKRLGVYLFLSLSIIGLIFSLIKIQKKKTNAFLLNKVPWMIYGVLLVCSFINWGKCVTLYNLSNNNFDWEYHLRDLNFNENELLEYAEISKDEKLKSDVLRRVENNQKESFLSKKVFYEMFKLKP